MEHDRNKATQETPQLHAHIQTTSCALTVSIIQFTTHKYRYFQMFTLYKLEHTVSTSPLPAFHRFWHGGYPVSEPGVYTTIWLSLPSSTSSLIVH